MKLYTNFIKCNPCNNLNVGSFINIKKWKLISLAAICLALPFTIDLTYNTSAHANSGPVIREWNRSNQKYNHHLVYDPYGNDYERNTEHTIYNVPSVKKHAKIVMQLDNGYGINSWHLTKDWQKSNTIVNLNGFKRVPNVFKNKNFKYQVAHNYTWYEKSVNPRTKGRYFAEPGFRWENIPMNYVSKKPLDWNILDTGEFRTNNSNSNNPKFKINDALYNVYKNIRFKVYRGAETKGHERYYKIVSSPNISPRIRGWVFRQGLDINNAPLNDKFRVHDSTKLLAKVMHNSLPGKKASHYIRYANNGNGFDYPICADNTMSLKMSMDKITRITDKKIRNHMKKLIVRNLRRDYRIMGERREDSPLTYIPETYGKHYKAKMLSGMKFYNIPSTWIRLYQLVKQINIQNENSWYNN